MRRFIRPLALCLLLAGTTGSALAAAPAAGGIAGQIKDPNGLVITGLDIPITAKGPDGKAYAATVGLDGHYAFRDLPPGDYELNLPIQCCMYRAYEQKGVHVGAGAVLALDLPIQWGINLGTIGDDPGMLGNDLRARSKNTKGAVPRTRDGHPDFTGIWYDIPKNTQSPPPQLKPWAQEIDKKLKAELAGDPNGPRSQGPAAWCLPQNATPTNLPFPYEFIQTKDRLIQLTEFLTPGHREIYLDGRKHPDMNEWNPAWYGHSVGRWEQDTLVIDSVGFNEITPGYSIHSEQLHVVERITRPAKDRLIVDITAEDPQAWTAPYHTVIEAGLVTGDEIHEWVCAENNRSDHFGILWRGRPEK